jgi:Flp pilus assembly protein TadB
VSRRAERRQRLNEKKKAEAARSAMRQARFRLNILEYLILLFAVLLALAGGGVVAWVLKTAASLPFRWTWVVSSLLLFIVPGGMVYLLELRRGAGRKKPDLKSEPKDPNG